MSADAFVRAAAFITVFGLSIAACGGAGTADESTPSGVSSSGERLYAANCASCHGTDLGGTDRGPSHLSVVYEPSHHGDDAFRYAISNGVQQHHWDFGDMPAVSGLSDDEVNEIIAFVRSEQERQGFESYPP